MLRASDARTIAGCCALVIFAALASPAPTPPPVEPPPRNATGPAIGAWGVDLTGMDRTVKPGDDFYAFVNGTWHKNAAFPGDKVELGGLVDLQEQALVEARGLLEEAAADTKAAPGSDRRKLGDWYASVMDQDRIDRIGIAAIAPEREAIARVRTRGELFDLLARTHSGLGTSVISVGMDFDRQTPNATLVGISAKGMSVPIRDFYLEAPYEPLRAMHRAHIARMFTLAGASGPEARAARVQALEAKIAAVTWTRAELRDPRRQQNRVTLAELSRQAPGMDWARFLRLAGIEGDLPLNLATPSTVAGVVKLLNDAPLQDWKDLLDYQLMVGTSTYLPRAFNEEVFAFYGKVLQGQPEQDARWRVALMDTAGQLRPLSDALGREYVQRYVPVDARPAARELVGNILTAFDARLATLEWMTESTRQGAREKLRRLTIKTLYPEAWLDTVGLEVVRGDAIGNARRASAFQRTRELGWLRAPMDRRMFLQPVFVVNAYALSEWNEIVFLAAIMRPPFFDPKADPAVNYGAIGAVIGHEISHLFDDKGRLTDAQGLLRDWWTDADAARFTATSERLAKQVAAYEVLPGKFPDGQLTLGESIADVAGLVVSLDAYRRSLGGKPAPIIDGYTAEQRFFLAYGQMWRWKGRDAYVEQLLKTDVHPPNNIRPNTVRNVDAWYEAFNVQPGDRLYLKPEDRVRMW